METVGEVTRLLLDWSDGNAAAKEDLLPLVYPELRRIARIQLSRERPGHTLQPTALVHEAYLKLVDQKYVTLESRAQFFGLAITIMRNILVDHARHLKAARNGGGEITVSLSAAERVAAREDVSLLALDDALNQLAGILPRHSRIVELRFFGGLTIEETGAALELSHATVERDWAFARAWLRRELTNV